MARALVLRDDDRPGLERLTRGQASSASLAVRARTVLLASEGTTNVEIGRLTGLSQPSVLKWRARYAQRGIDGLRVAPRPGRVPAIDELAVVAETLADSGKPPVDLGISHWSVRLMADRLGISFSSVGRIWRKWKIQPHRLDTFKFSTDPELEAKLRDVVGLYMSPPENAVVVSVDEKSQIQALDRTRPDQPLEKGRPAARTHDYQRNGTTTLFAALDIAIGKLSADKCYPKHTNVEFVDFLSLVVAAHPNVELHVVCDNYATHKHPNVELHVVCDNYATHKHPNVKAWLAANPRVTMHLTPTSCSWLNMVEIFFGIITKQAIRRGSFRSARQVFETV